MATILCPFELRPLSTPITTYSVHTEETGRLLGKIQRTEVHPGRPWQAVNRRGQVVGQFCSRMDACCSLRGSELNLQNFPGQ